MHKGYALGLAVVIFVFVSTKQNRISKNTPFSGNMVSTPTSTPLDFFPGRLECSFQRNLGIGPTWQNITIGKSSANELKVRLSSLRYTEGNSDDGLMFISNSNPQEDLPIAIQVCLLQNTVSALKLMEIVKETPTFLPNFVTLYGRPDKVTWTTNPASRVVFWFRKGTAATVYTGSDAVNFGRISDVIYFPYIEGEYLNVWPYSQTRPEGYENSEYIPDQNPFNFGEIIATITAQSPYTSTPTITRIP